jgi:hypothetical protein
MVEYCVLKRTKVTDDEIILPRPKLTQELVMKGSKEQCLEKVEQLSALPENQSTDIIDVEIICVRWVGQKTQTSARIGNGSRNIDN